MTGIFIVATLFVAVALIFILGYRIVELIREKLDKTNSKLHNLNKTQLNMVKAEEETNKSLLELLNKTNTVNPTGYSDSFDYSAFMISTIENIFPSTSYINASPKNFIEVNTLLTALLQDCDVKIVYQNTGGKLYRVKHKNADIAFYLMFRNGMSLNYVIGCNQEPDVKIEDGEYHTGFYFFYDISEYDIKNSYLKKILEKNQIGYTVKPMNFKKSALLYFPILDDKGRYYFESRQTKAFSKFFKFDLNDLYEDFDMAIRGQQVSCSPEKVFDFMKVVLTKTSKNVFLEGEPGTGKTSWLNRMKSVLSEDPNNRVFSLDASSAANLFSKDFANAMRSIAPRFRMDDDDSPEVKNYFFIEDGEAIFNEAFKDGKKTTAASAILDMLDGANKQLYNMVFIVSSNTEISKYSEVITSRFPYVFQFKELSYYKGIALVNKLEQMIQKEEMTDKFVDWSQIHKDKKPMTLRHIFFNVFKDIEEDRIVRQIEEELLHSSTNLERSKFVNVADKIDIKQDPNDLSLENKFKNFEKSVNIEEEFILPDIHDNVQQVKDILPIIPKELKARKRKRK